MGTFLISFLSNTHVSCLVFLSGKKCVVFFPYLVDVDECESRVCEEECVNTPGSFHCFCDGRQGKKLGQNLRSCEVMNGIDSSSA